MAGPVVATVETKTLTKDTWVKVVTDTVWGEMYKLDKSPNKYLYTCRISGDPAPTDTTEGAPIFVKEEKKLIISAVGIDVYVMAVGAQGKIRCDWYL